MAQPLPPNFLLFNEESTKQLAVVVEIPGVDLLTNRPIYTTIRYGDPEIFYGDAGLFYGGLRLVQGVQDIIDLDKATMTLSQRLEPEIGKGAIQQINLTFIDLNGYMSQVISPGVIIPEILGADVRIWIGYVGTSFPDDYFVVFRGVITGVDSYPGYVNLQFSDSNVKRRTYVCFTPQVPLAAALGPYDSIVAVLNNSNFYQQIQGPDGTYDVDGPWNSSDGKYNMFANRPNGVRTYLLIDNEYIEYGPLGFLTQPTAELQNIKYVSANGNIGAIVNYVNNGLPGFEYVTVLNTTITIGIATGGSTVEDIMTALNTPSATIQSLYYRANDLTNTSITVAYTPGGVAGSEVVMVTGNAISIQIQSGASTAQDIEIAIANSVAASALINVYPTASGHPTDNQSAPWPATPLIKSALALVTPSKFMGTLPLENILYTIAEPQINDPMITYTDGAPTPDPIVTITSGNINIQIQSGVTTADQIVVAMNTDSGVAALGVTQSIIAYASIQSLYFWPFNEELSDITVQLITGGAFGNEFVNVNGLTVTIAIQSGASTPSTVIAALAASGWAGHLLYAAVAPGASYNDALTAPSAVVTLGGSGISTQSAPLGPVSIGNNPQVAPGGPALVAYGFDGVLRGARGTTPSSHDVDSTVSSAIQITENAIIFALKMSLSGWDGPWISNVAIFSIVRTGDTILGDQPGAIILPTSIDAIRDYGLVPGDWVTISGSSIPGNNISSPIVRFGNLNGQNNRIIYLQNQTLTEEFPVSGPITPTVAFRSQYDTYPTLCGAQLYGYDMDVQGHLTILDDWLSDPGNTFQFLINAEIDNLKEFIETQVFLPCSAYSLTRRGALSVNITKPPLVQGQLVILNSDNIIMPESITIGRATNNRKFYNEIDYTIDYDDSGQSQTTLDYLNVDSLSLIGISSVLPIDGQGIKTALGSVPLLADRANNLLTRYKYAAAILSLTANWGIGVTIEAGDIVAVVDNGTLKITNFATGDRDLGTQLFEVVDRQLDIKSATCKLQLISGIGLSITDRYGVVSPSSYVVSGTNSYLIIEDSFGAQYPGNEMEKWINFQGQPIVLHDYDYTVSYPTTITGFDPVNNYKMTISGFETLPPSFDGLIMDIPNYPQTTQKIVQSMYKAIFAYYAPQVTIVTGISETEFTVSSGDVGKFFVGSLVRVSSVDYSTFSGTTEFTVSSIVGTTITLSKPLSFIPAPGYIVNGIGMPDLTGAYRLI